MSNFNGAKLCLVLAAFFVSPFAEAVTFNLTDGAGLSSLAVSNPTLYSQVRGGFTEAANLWSAQLVDAVTVNITIDYAALNPGVLGQASSLQFVVPYSDVRTALIGDATSALDATAVANLQAGPALQFVTTDTATAGRPRILDNDATLNNTGMRVNSANMRAMGLAASPASDASITFSSNFSFDFDRSNGIDSSLFDFVGIAAHEIGHSLGCSSGVDRVDTTGTGTSLNGTRTFLTPDLFRYSGAADTNVSGFGRVMDHAEGGTPYFSVDRGATNLGDFSTGRNNGDGQQASHWKDDQGLGIMDPTAGPGELLAITIQDLQLFDAIGWNLAIVPEPGTAALALLALPGLAALRRRRA